MPQTLGNLARVPINSDALNVTGDMASLAQSLEIVVPVASDAAGDTYATERNTAGFPVSDTRPLFVYNTTTKSIRIKDSSGWRDLAVALRHAEYTGSNVNQTADAGTAFGTFTVDATKTFNNTFASPGGAGVLNILEAGTYVIVSNPQPPSSLGANVHVWGTHSTGFTFMSQNFNSYGSSQPIVAVTAYLPVGTITMGVTGNNTVSNIGSRVKLTKLQG